MAIFDETVFCWLNPFAGLGGDMLLAALLDAGAPLDAVRAAVARTGLTGWDLDAHRIVTHNLAATRIVLQLDRGQNVVPAAQLIDMAARVTPAPVARLAVSALTALAETEARLFTTATATTATTTEGYPFEAGGREALIHIVGVAAALHALDVGSVVSAPLPLNAGRVLGPRGVVPHPSPTTVALLEGAAVVSTDLLGETVTPTAAALLKASAARYGGPPGMTVGRTGYGAGSRTLESRPNVAAATLGRAASPGTDGSLPSGSIEERLALLETNLDDVTAEAVAYTVGSALDAGAHDVWVTPAVMRRGRPAHVLHVAADPEAADQLERLIFALTGSLSVRRSTMIRTTLPRDTETVDLNGHLIRISVGPHAAKPEFDDVASAASDLDLPPHVVSRMALELHARACEQLAPLADSVDD